MRTACSCKLNIVFYLVVVGVKFGNRREQFKFPFTPLHGGSSIGLPRGIQVRVQNLLRIELATLLRKNTRLPTENRAV